MPVFQRFDGIWISQVWHHGRAIHRSPNTRKEAEAKLAELERLRATKGRPTLRGRPNLRLDDVLRQWLDVQRGRLAPSTGHSHETIVRAHLLPAFGTLRLRDLTAPALATLYEWNPRSGLSRRRVQMIHRLLPKALRDAVAGSYLGVAYPATSQATIPRGGQ